jgi:hypothetical protein
LSRKCLGAPSRLGGRRRSRRHLRRISALRNSLCAPKGPSHHWQGREQGVSVSLYGYERWRWVEQDEHWVSEIEKVVREVWPCGNSIVRRALRRLRAQAPRWGVQVCGRTLWAVETLQPCRAADAVHGSKHWQAPLTSLSMGPTAPASNRCSTVTFCLHTLVRHCRDFMEHCLRRKRTIGIGFNILSSGSNDPATTINMEHAPSRGAKRGLGPSTRFEGPINTDSDRGANQYRVRSACSE